jgi:hypothetical protein
LLEAEVVALELAEFQLEYVTGAMVVPPIGDPTRSVVPVISVTNVGPTAAHTRTLVYRATPHDQEQQAGFNQVLDSATDNVSYGEPITDLVRPGTTWSWRIDDFTGEVGSYIRFWFSIRATSPNLVPSIEFIEAADPSAEPEHFTQTMDLRYMPGDFALFHHRIRYMAPVPPGPRTMLE